MKITKIGILPERLPSEAVNILFHYAQPDRHVFQSFAHHLRTDSRLKAIDSQEAIPGSLWEQERDQKIRSADCIIFLLSRDFFGDEVVAEEANMMLQQRKDLVQTGLVLNMVIRPVGWKSSQFGLLPTLLEGAIVQGDASQVKAIEEISQVLVDRKLL